MRALASSGPTFLLYASLALFLGSTLYSRHVVAVATAAAGLPQIGARVPFPSGFDRAGNPVAPVPAAGCTLVHYSWSGCEYCRAEATVWARVAVRAAAGGCLIRGIVPTHDQPTANPTSTGVIVYLSFPWVDAVPLRAAPTTLLLDHDGRVMWSHLGNLDQRLAAQLISKIATVQPNAVSQRH